MVKRFVLAAAVVGVGLALTSGAMAAQINHDHFVSAPYADNWCGIDGTSVDTIVANYTPDGSRSSINVKTIFTATASGKSMEIQQTGLQRQGAPVDNGNGTDSVTFANAGQSPTIKLPGGEVLPGTGLIVGVLTFDSTTGEFLSFNIVKQAGQRGGDACAEIVPALS
jgi:hypothetical protein